MMLKKENIMANNELFMVSPNPLNLSSGNNTFVSNWMDKRSSSTFGVSIIFYGPNAPDGYAWLELSNAPLQSGTSYGQPQNGGDDAAVLTGSQQTITQNVLTGLYSAQWQISCIGAHFVRLRYSSLGNVSGLSVSVYGNAVFNSQ
jgi:hypothetical protein